MKHQLKIQELHRPDQFQRHCEIVHYLLQLPDLENSAVKHHLRNAVREASNHASTGPGYHSKLSARYMSVSAAKQMEDGKTSGLVGEHLVPVSVLNRMIVGAIDPGWEDIADILLEFGPRAVITEQEHEDLKKHGMHKTMPKGWDGEDLFARYREVGIRLIPSRYAELIRRLNR